MIASHPKVIYVAEPFNKQFAHRRCPVRYWFEYVTPRTEEAFRQLAEEKAQNVPRARAHAPGICLHTMSASRWQVFTKVSYLVRR